MPEGIEPLLNVGQLAQALNVDRSWIYARTRVDKLPCLRLGKYRRFRLGDVLAYLAGEAS